MLELYLEEIDLRADGNLSCDTISVYFILNLSLKWVNKSVIILSAHVTTFKIRQWSVELVQFGCNFSNAIKLLITSKWGWSNGPKVYLWSGNTGLILGVPLSCYISH